MTVSKMTPSELSEAKTLKPLLPRSELAKDFLFIYNDWFAKKYQKKQDGRYPTFKAALNLMLQRNGAIVLETGCARMHGDFGAGLSSLLFCEVLNRYGGHLYSVDIDPRNIKTCAEITAEFKDQITLVCADSVAFIRNPVAFGVLNLPKVDLLYLDSWDYPYGEMLNYYGGRSDINKAIEILNTVTEEEVYKIFKSLIDPCQEHCVNEFMAAQQYLHDDTVVLIDDSNFIGRGKPGKLNDWLIENGYELILDFQQSLWIKKSRIID